MLTPRRQKTGGRQKGTPNKVNAQLRTLISNLLEENFDEVALEFKTLKGKDKINAFESMLPYIMPKMQAVQTSINYDDLTDDQLQDLLNKIIQHCD